MRSIALWALLTATMVAELLIFRFRPRRPPWPRLGSAPLSAMTYVLVRPAFLTLPGADRLPSAAKCTGHALLLLAVIAWPSDESATVLIWAAVALTSMVIGLRLWHGHRAGRAAERATAAPDRPYAWRSRTPPPVRQRMQGADRRHAVRRQRVV
ncbi:hypothetical protein E1286_41420 [Nonomuraea terrae]|uniref:Uncharacterized protein n=1 Tax=Nonomuraea terrae TaxID=2530383 RepID=A0A4V6PDH0_9ACTN|nr:hypothetical protein [Nonomuraea terrae]TDD34007.1 hypothetical protein E1286_41420 [Nonomuraea terrae]